MATSASTYAQLKWYESALLAVLAVFMRAWGRTLRFRWGSDVQSFIDRKAPASVIIFWHNRLFAAPLFYNRYFRKRRLATLISASKDGAWPAEFVRRLGMRPVRGSRHKRGIQAVRELLAAQHEGYDVALTPDGSRGPVYDMKPGAVGIALKTGAPIVLLSLNYSRAWRLKSWDGFYVPHPFSPIEVRIDWIESAATLGKDAETAATKLKARMDAITLDSARRITPRANDSCP
jgi:lysophospholipid acyltransferase (LPLAT)-like uncharacterized protein